MKRSALKAKPLPRSEVRRRAAVKAEVFHRDGYRCRLEGHLAGRPCWGPLTVHHLHKAGQGGPYARDNLLAACLGHNRWVELEPDRAHALGLVKRNGDTLEECWSRLRLAFLVSYGP